MREYARAALSASTAPKAPKASAGVLRGLSAIHREMQSIADDMGAYKDADEKSRARDIRAGLKYLDEFVAVPPSDKENAK